MGRVGRKPVDLTRFPASGENPARLGKDQVEAWRTAIETVWKEFREGRADVDPNPDGHPCPNCHLPGLCRVKDSGIPGDPDEESADAAD